MGSGNYYLAAVQIASHPSVEVEGVNLLMEPHPSASFTLERFKELIPHDTQFIDYIKQCQARCKSIYLDWARKRLSSIFTWLAALQFKPDVIAFPEGSIPFELLSIVKDFADTHDCAIFAGTHRFIDSEYDNYRKLGFQTEDLDDFRFGPLRSMMPIFDKGRSRLRGKIYLAPPERPSAHNEGQYMPVLDVVTVRTKSGEINVLPLICSEATQLNAAGTKEGQDIHLVVVSAFQRAASTDYFEWLKKVYVKNDIPVVYVNDGSIGGSEVHTNWPASPRSWFRHGPLNGVLPKGDSILIVKTRPGDLGVRVGQANPQQFTALVKLSAVVSGSISEPDVTAVERINELLKSPVRSERSKILPNLSSMSEACSPLLSAKIGRIVQLYERDSSPDAATLAVHQNDCITSCSIDLKGLERGMCKNILPILEEIKPAVDWHRSNNQADNDAAWYHLNLCASLRDLSGEARAGQKRLAQLALTTLAKYAKGSESHSLLSLNHTLGYLLERFEGTACSLDLITRGVVEPLIAHNTSLGSFQFFGAPRSLEAHSLPYLNNDWSEEYHAQDSNGRSILAVPLLHPVSSDVIGRFIITTNYRNAFTPLQIGELMSACQRLVVDLLIITSIRSSLHFGWHPALHGWDSELVLNGLCFKLSTLDRQFTLRPDISVTIWYYDRSAKKIYARGTAQFDHEYEADKSLPFNSFTGTHIDATRIEVAHTGPKGAFRRHLKAARMELARISSVPVFSNRGSSKLSSGCINIYEFHKPARFNDHEFVASGYQITDNDLVDLSRTIGRLIDDFHSTRLEVAISFLRSRLSEDALLGYNGFQMLLETLLKVLSAEAGSIFALEEDRLQCVATTGLMSEKGEMMAQSDCYYEFGAAFTGGIGFTTHLASNPGSILRRNQVSDRAIDGFPITPSNKFRELFSLSEADHRRYLGYSIATEDNKTLGVIRLLRRASSRPFVEGDERLLMSLAKEAEQVFLLHQHLSLKAPLLSKPTKAAKLLKMPWSPKKLTETAKMAAARILRPVFFYERWNRFEIDAILQDINVIFKPLGSIAAILGIEKFDSSGKAYVHHCNMHNNETNEQPSEEDYPLSGSFRDFIAFKCLLEMLPYFYWSTNPNYRQLYPSTLIPHCGICIPFCFANHWWDDGQPLKGVLRVEFESFFDLSQNHLSALFCAIIKLTKVGEIERRESATIDFYTEANTRSEFIECCKRDASYCGMEVEIVGVDRNNITGVQNSGNYKFLWLASQPAIAVQIVTVSQAAHSLWQRMSLAWCAFLNRTTGENMPWSIPLYEAKIREEHLQSLGVIVDWT